MNLTKLITIILCLEVFLVPLFFIPGSGAFGGFALPLHFNKVVLMVILCLTALSLFLTQAIQSAKLRFRRTPLDYFVLGFFLFYTLAFAFSPARYISLFHWLSILFLVIFYFLVTNVIEKREKLLSFVVWSAAAVSIVFLVSLFFLRQKIGILNTLGSQSSLAAFAALAAVLAQMFLLRGGERLRPDVSKPEKSDPKSDSTSNVKNSPTSNVGPTSDFGSDFKSPLSKISYLLALALFLAVIALINFKIGWLILVVGSLVLLALCLARSQPLGFKKHWIALPVIMALIGLFFLFLETPLVYNANLPPEVSLSQTVSLRIAWDASTKNIFGTGPGNFTTAFSLYKPVTLSQGLLWQLRFNQASSQIAELLATGGWLCFLSWLALIVLALTIVFLQGALLPFFLCLLVVSWYLSFTPFWWLLFFTILASSTPRKGKPLQFSLKKSSYSLFLLSLLFIAFLVLVIFFLSFIGRLYLADYHFQRDNLTSALKYNPREPGYFLWQADVALGQTLQAAQAGDQTLAITSLGQAVNYSKTAFDLAPYNVAVCERRAWIFEQSRGLVTGGNEWVIKTYEKCLALEPGNPFFHQQLGLALALGEEEEQALAELKKAIELRPQMSVAQYELGRIYYNREELLPAEEHFTAAVSVAPDYANALYSLALVYERQDRKEEALTLFKRVLQLNPDSIDLQEKIKELEE